MLSPAVLPADTQALQALLREREAMVLRLQETVRAQQAALDARSAEIAYLKLVIAKLKHLQFGRKSEKLDREIEQLELRLEELQADEGAVPAEVVQPLSVKRTSSRRTPLPPHLPRDERIHLPKRRRLARTVVGQ